MRHTLDEMMDFLETLNINQQVFLWNSYTSGKYINFLEEGVINTLDMTPGELAYGIMHGSCNWDDLYFYIDDRGKMKTFTTKSNSNNPIDIKELAQSMINGGYRMPEEYNG